ncbi:patatin-like phospholipase [Catovirus CTV1]|uniref:Patatin-like phospholipase n=1 Tax=Catovirus CTV1 TaxID=1977631 RepID=A0A1V0SCG0_9VIRU|nr:patatin-like phospholipase [Catovirus CTV1]
MNVENLEEKIKREAISIINNITNVDLCSELKKKTKLVLSGGGIKGIAHVGALQALHDYGCLDNIDTVAGTSVGALIGTLFIIGYTPKDLYDFIMIFDMSKMGGLKAENFLEKFGLDDGRKILTVIKTMFKNKGFSEDVTFKELYDKVKKKIIMTVTCINDKKAYYYSVDTFPQVKVLKALRMSISIPVYFTPIEHNGHLYVDGGCIDNYPMQLFSNNLDETIGFYLTDIKDYVEKIENIEDTLIHTFLSMIEGISCNSLKGFEKYSIKINLSGISLMDLNLNKQKKQEIFDTGYNSFIKKYIT